MSFLVKVDHVPPPAVVITVIVAETEEEVARLFKDVPVRGPQWDRDVQWQGPLEQLPLWSVTVMDRPLWSSANDLPILQQARAADQLLRRDQGNSGDDGSARPGVLSLANVPRGEPWSSGRAA